jgi:hypothetical protein
MKLHLSPRFLSVATLGILTTGSLFSVKAQNPWRHSDVYEARADRNGVKYICVITVDDTEIQVKVENKTRSDASMNIGDQKVVFEGYSQGFTINRTDGKMSSSYYMKITETDKGPRFMTPAKGDPTLAEALKPLRDMLAELPEQVSRLLEKLLK